MNERDSVVTGIVEMSYNWSYSIIYNGVTSYTHFHNACLKFLILFGCPSIIILITYVERMGSYGIYVLPRSSDKMGHF